MVLVAAAGSGCAVPGKSGQLGPCEFDATGWSHPTYNFSGTGTYFGCQSDHTETWFISGFDGIILSDDDAVASASAAGATWSDPLTGWTFDASADPSLPQSDDGLSDISAADGHPAVADEVADTWKYVSVAGDDLECETIFYTQLIDDNAVVWDLDWIFGAGQGYDLNTFMLHEMGHCIGFGHPDSPTDYPNSVMQESTAAGEVRTVLDPIDVEAVRFLYQPNGATTPTTPTTP